MVRLMTSLNAGVARWRTMVEQGSVPWQASATVECDGAKREQHVKEKLKND